VLYDLHLGEAGSVQQSEEFVRVGKTKHIVALRHVERRRYASLGNGITEDALNTLARGIIPPCKRNASAGRQGSYALCDSKFWSGKMSKPESADDCVKRMIRKREMFYVSLTKFDLGV